MPSGTTPISARPRSARPALVTGLLLVVLTAGVAGAGPALAVDDPSRPDAVVTHGPSCHPGGVVVEVTAGTAPYSVRLATTRQPAGEDEAAVQPGETAVLATGDVDWAETIDSRLEYTALDGSGISYVDELEDYSFTRPTEEDCAAIAAPPPPAAPSAPSSSAPSSAAAPEPAVPDTGAVVVEPGADGQDGGDGGDGPPATGPSENPASGPEDTGAGVAPEPAEPSGPAPPNDGPLAAQVAPAADARAITSWPLFSAALSLLATGTGLLLVAARRWTAGRRRPSTGSA